MYSREGPNLLVRNMLAKARLRHLIVWGVELTGAGAALVRLVDRDDGTVIDRAVSRRLIEARRHRVVLQDRRGERDPAAVRVLVSELPLLVPNNGVPYTQDASPAV
jgi:hypothetical protein